MDEYQILINCSNARQFVTHKNTVLRTGQRGSAWTTTISKNIRDRQREVTVGIRYDFIAFVLGQIIT